MMSSKSITVVVLAVAVAGAAAVATRQFGAKGDPAQTTERAPNGAAGAAQSQPLRAPSGSPDSGPSRANDRIDDHDPDGEGFGNQNRGRSAERSRVPGNRQDRARNGTYITTFAGFFVGSGTAEVQDDRVSLRATIATVDGRNGELVADNLTVEGPYFFGTGTMLGETVEVNGRVDAARASRLLAQITASQGRSARAVGNLPATLDAGDDNWDANDHPTRMGDGR